MTDLISKLADDIVALNNASPRLPRKEQIEEVLRAALDPFTLDGSTFICGQTVLWWTGHNDITHSHSITFTGAPTYTGSSLTAQNCCNGVSHTVDATGRCIHCGAQ